MDYTSLSVFMQKNSSRMVVFVLVLVSFIAGWQAGRVMSPYYASHPIVFEDRQCAECSSSGGSGEELAELKVEGQGETSKAITNTTAEPVVAGTQSVSVVNASSGKFVGSINSNLYHHPDCSHAKRISAQNQIWFSTQEEANVAGYTPSKCTQDKLGL